MVESPEGLGDDPDHWISRQRDFFTGRGQAVEWKTYGYDEPARPRCAAVCARFCGGSTHPEWRRRGLYRATVAYRARLALDRGYRFACDDASPNSRPILNRLGLHQVSTTTPYRLAF